MSEACPHQPNGICDFCEIGDAVNDPTLDLTLDELVDPRREDHQAVRFAPYPWQHGDQ